MHTQASFRHALKVSRGDYVDGKIPELYETEDVPLDKKMIHQRYRIKEIAFYWLIAEVDRKRNLAFGYANLNDDQNAEWGYISIDELNQNGAELDREWKPCSYRDAVRKIRIERAERGERC